jgi:beta-xylosidase
MIVVRRGVFRAVVPLAMAMATVLLVCAALLASSTPKPDQIRTAWGDQSDGTFVNPVLPADYSDIDVIRVGNDFYTISSTFQFSPGIVILRSKDLVNWTIVGHAVADLTQISPELNWDRMNRYGRGIWAGAIRHRAGKYWIYFGTPDEGFFMTSALEATGPWQPLMRVLDVRGWDDCCPFWDDDGQGYLVCTNFADHYKVHLFKMTADGKGIVEGYDKVIHQSPGSEANKLYKIDGQYYHFFSEVKKEGRVAMIGRAKSLEGPWEVRQINHVASNIDREPNQGGLIELTDNHWWFLSHEGTGGWEGRAMCLLPVTWSDGWPVIGTPGVDGIGNMVWRSEKPIAGQATSLPQASDTFDENVLGNQWEWNYEPRADKWSLKARPGFLRLEAFRPLKSGDLLKAGNTLTQRVWRGAKCEAMLAMDVSGMADGQRAGLCHFARAYSMIGIMQERESRMLFVEARGKVTRGPNMTGRMVWLRSEWAYDGTSQYSWSTDGKVFSALGPTCPLTWSFYRGDRLGIFTFNDKSDSGFIDVDCFTCNFQ